MGSPEWLVLPWFRMFVFQLAYKILVSWGRVSRSWRLVLGVEAGDVSVVQTGAAIHYLTSSGYHLASLGVQFFITFNPTIP